MPTEMVACTARVFWLMRIYELMTSGHIKAKRYVAECWSWCPACGNTWTGCPTMNSEAKASFGRLPNRSVELRRLLWPVADMPPGQRSADLGQKPTSNVRHSINISSTERDHRVAVPLKSVDPVEFITGSFGAIITPAILLVACPRRTLRNLPVGMVQPDP
jgi:hypothetical protein